MSDADRIKGYANGLFEIARGEGDLPRIESELHQVAQVFDGSEELRNTLSDPALPADRKRGIINELLGGRASDVTVAAVDLIVGAGRAKDLSAITDEFLSVAASSRSREVAEVRSAVELDADTVRRLETSLARATGKAVEVRVIVDPSILGGIVARVGDTVIDGSVRRRLDSLRQAISA